MATETKLQMTTVTKQRAIAITLLPVHVQGFDGIIAFLWKMD